MPIPTQLQVVEAVRRAYAQEWLRHTPGWKCSVSAANAGWYVRNGINTTQVFNEAARAGLVEITYDGGNMVFVVPLGAPDRKDREFTCSACGLEVAKYFHADGGFTWLSKKNTPTLFGAEAPEGSCWKSATKVHVVSQEA